MLHVRGPVWVRLWGNWNDMWHSDECARLFEYSLCAQQYESSQRYSKSEHRIQPSSWTEICPVHQRSADAASVWKWGRPSTCLRHSVHLVSESERRQPCLVRRKFTDGWICIWERLWVDDYQGQDWAANLRRPYHWEQKAVFRIQRTGWMLPPERRERGRRRHERSWNQLCFQCPRTQEKS